MAGRVSWTQTAWSDLEAVADYIAKDSRHYAAAFVGEVRDAARSLGHVAERGRVVPEFHDPSIRELFVRDYRLVYQVVGSIVYIIGFIHGARDLWTLWEREGRFHAKNTD